MRLRSLLLVLVLCWLAAGLAAPPAVCAERPNVLLICVDDLRPELGCYGVEYIHSPNIDRLASGGSLFSKHYVQAPTCGASRFTLLTGRYGGASNGALFQRAERLAGGEDVPPSLPAWFRQHGYTTVSVGKVSHHPGGRGGSDWNDVSEPEMPESWDRHLCPTGDWQHPRGVMHGLAHGEIREDAKEMDLFQSAEGDDAIYPDGLIVNEALQQLDELASQPAKPFFLAVGIIRPHLPFGAPAKYMQPYRDVVLPPIPHPSKPVGQTTWHASGEFMKYNRWGRDPREDAEFADEVRRHYAACVTYADSLVGDLLERLTAHQLSGNTIVVLWGDHGWHLGEHAIWGKHALFEESLRSPLIIHGPGVEPSTISSIVESVDIFPTLCELATLPTPDFIDGESLRPLIHQPSRAAAEETAISYTSRARTLRTARYRLIVHTDGFSELYDHDRDPDEQNNIAQDRPQVVQQLTEVLERAKP